MNRDQIEQEIQDTEIQDTFTTLFPFINAKHELSLKIANNGVGKHQRACISLDSVQVSKLRKVLDLYDSWIVGGSIDESK